MDYGHDILNSVNHDINNIDFKTGLKIFYLIL